MLWECRVVVPPQGRKQALQMLLESHPGISRIKPLPRSYMWWPRMDKEIEHYVNEFSDCQFTQNQFHSIYGPGLRDHPHRQCRANGRENFLTNGERPLQMDGD